MRIAATQHARGWAALSSATARNRRIGKLQVKQKRRLALRTVATRRGLRSQTLDFGGPAALGNQPPRLLKSKRQS